MPRSRLIAFLSILFIAAAAVSCGGGGDREIDQVLDARTKAFETKDAALYMTLVSPDYKQEKKGKTVGPEEVEKNFRINVDLFDKLSVRNADRTISSDGKKAHVVQKTYVDASIDDSKSKFRIIEKISLARINGKWLIVEESDADFFTGYVFGGSK
ncbi:MAG: nuclear transport factor 2 family protein [Candidatus Dadabacteria bacterium]|nr:nuclear transport factor 2 family protein [Candidatus Dadabacteria bacterium]